MGCGSVRSWDQVGDESGSELGDPDFGEWGTLGVLTSPSRSHILYSHLYNILLDHIYSISKAKCYINAFIVVINCIEYDFLLIGLTLSGAGLSPHPAPFHTAAFPTRKST